MSRVAPRKSVAWMKNADHGVEKAEGPSFDANLGLAKWIYPPASINKLEDIKPDHN
jgi:hypothetical protein